MAIRYIVTGFIRFERELLILFCSLITMKIENFINRIEVNRQFARSTVNSYTRILNNFNEYVKELYI